MPRIAKLPNTKDFGVAACQRRYRLFVLLRLRGSPSLARLELSHNNTTIILVPKKRWWWGGSVSIPRPIRRLIVTKLPNTDTLTDTTNAFLVVVSCSNYTIPSDSNPLSCKSMHQPRKTPNDNMRKCLGGCCYCTEHFFGKGDATAVSFMRVEKICVSFFSLDW